MGACVERMFLAENTSTDVLRQEHGSHVQETDQ